MAIKSSHLKLKRRAAMFGTNGKSRYGNPPVVWQWINNRPVTGHFRNGTLVDQRNGFMEFFMNADDGLMVEFRPGKGVFVAPLTLEVDIIETRTTRFGRTIAYKVSFKLSGTLVKLVLPQRHQYILD